MMTNSLTNESLYNYFDSLIGKFYKILPLKEKHENTLNTYLDSLKSELIGYTNLFVEFKKEPQFISLLSILQFLIDGQYNDIVCKREVFRSIRIINHIKNQYCEGGESFEA